MVVTRLGCQNFRNLRDGELFPCPGVNVIYGGNAQGKTNLLEGLWLFTGGHSFRGAKDVELPRLDTATGENAPTAALALDFFSEGREQKALLQFENGRRSSVINGVKKKTGSALVGKVCAVIFSPEHLLLVKEGPARRRGFLDGALCQIRPRVPAGAVPAERFVKGHRPVPRAAGHLGGVGRPAHPTGSCRHGGAPPVRRENSPPGPGDLPGHFPGKGRALPFLCPLPQAPGGEFSTGLDRIV